MPSCPELTLCTVSYESAEWLRLNLDLVKQLNPGVRFHWLVAENSPPGSSGRLYRCEPGFEVFDGAEYEDRRYGSASYHHAAGLNVITRIASTRYLLILDPDFFIIRRNWIKDVIAYMRSRDVAILGAPWHPKRSSKFRYFPCAHCTFIDLHKIHRDRLDFSPDYEGDPAWLGLREHPGSRLNAVIARLTLARRRRVGRARDTGWRLLHYHREHPSVKVECFQPVFKPRVVRRMLDLFFPDHLSLTPKRRGYFSKTGFAVHGFPDVQSNGWEEFLWNREPFGFHVRCYPIRQKKSDYPLEAHYRSAKNLLEQLE